MSHEEARYEAEREYFRKGGGLAEPDAEFRAFELEMIQVFEAAIANKGGAA